MGTKNNPGQFDCYAKALPDEPMFVLLGRDPLAGFLTSIWAKMRVGDFEAAFEVFKAMMDRNPEYIASPDVDKAYEAIACALRMFDYRKEREAAKERVAKIDKKFEEASGWGSWMADASKERENLANRFGFEHNHQVGMS